MSKFPTDLKYTNEHEWVRVEGDIAVVGITSYAAEQLGGVTFVEFPETGMQVEQMDVLGSIESLMGFSDLFSLVIGEVVEVISSLVYSWVMIVLDSYC
jgi:glycine cleavage system H protein